GGGADQRLRKAPDDILHRQRQRKVGRRHREVVGDRRQEQSETLAYPHAQREQQRGANQDQPGLAVFRDDRWGHSGGDPGGTTQSHSLTQVAANTIANSLTRSNAANYAA